MKALSVLQPWAWAILEAGKCVENRTWPTDYRGPLLIHAGGSPRELVYHTPARWLARYGRTHPGQASLTFGAVIGAVELVDCVEPQELDSGNPWVEGLWCWVLTTPRTFVRPVSLPGQLRLFDVPDDLVADQLRG